MQRDVIVIGAGVTGCAIAAHLLRLAPALHVVLFDRHHVGAGSTSRSTAAFRHQWSLPAHVAFSDYASREYDAFAQRGRPLQFRRNGYLFLYTDPGRWEAARGRIRTQRDMGVPVEALTPDELARVPGGDRVDDPAVLGATWGPRDGFLDPLALAQTYLDEAREAGVDYRPSTAVTRIERSKGAWRVVAQDATWSAHRVVLCAGIWSAPVAAQAGLPLPLRAAKRYLYHSRPIQGVSVGAWPLLIGDGGAHCRPEEGNRLLLAWEAAPAPEPPGSESVLWEAQDRIEPGFGSGSEGHGVRTLTELARHVPWLAESVALDRVTSGYYAVSPDHKAILGEDPRAAGFFHACGFSGHGIMHAAATGRTLAECVLGRAPGLIDAGTLSRGFGLGPLLSGEGRAPAEDLVL